MPETQYTPDPRATRDAFLSRGYGCFCRGGGLPAELMLGLIHYWALEEASGNRIDAVGSSDLREQNGVVGSAAGINGNGAQSPGGNIYLIKDPSFVVSPPFSFAFWVKLATFGTGFGFDVAEISEGLTGPFFTITNAGALEISNGTDALVMGQSIGALNTWHLVVFTVLANGTYSLSIDNSVFTTAVAPTPPGPSSYINLLFAISSGNDVMDGVMDEVAIWSRALTQADVDLLWNSGAGIFL